MSSAQEGKSIRDIADKISDEFVTKIEQSSDELAPIYIQEWEEQFTTTLEKAKHNIALGLLLYRRGAYSHCITYFKRGIEWVDIDKDAELYIKTYLNIGNAHLALWENQDALDAYFKVIDIEQAIESQEISITANHNIAIIKRRMNQLDQALKVCNKALASIKGTASWEQSNHVNLLTIACEVHLDLAHWDKVIALANRGLEISKALDFAPGQVDLYAKKGAVYFHKEDYERALYYLQEAECITEMSNEVSKTHSSNTLYFQAACHAATNNHELAIDYLNKVTALIDGSDRTNWNRLEETYKLLAFCYEEVGEIQTAKDWLEQYISLNELNQKNKDRVVNTIYQEETALLERQIEVLEKKSDKGLKYTLYAFVILGLGLVLYLSRRSLRKQNTVVLGQTITALDIQKKGVVIDDQKKNEIIKGLERLERQEFFLSTECSLRTMAKKVKTNATYLSKIINEHKGANFNDYINALRIEYAVNRINNDRKFRSFSVKSIASELGYKSDYSFAKHFKSRIGMNPSFYIRSIDNNEKPIVEV